MFFFLKKFSWIFSSKQFRTNDLFRGFTVQIVTFKWSICSSLSKCFYRFVYCMHKTMSICQGVAQIFQIPSLLHLWRINFQISKAKIYIWSGCHSETWRVKKKVRANFKSAWKVTLEIPSIILVTKKKYFFVGQYIQSSMERTI